MGVGLLCSGRTPCCRQYLFKRSQMCEREGRGERFFFFSVLNIVVREGNTACLKVDSM